MLKKNDIGPQAYRDAMSHFAGHVHVATTDGPGGPTFRTTPLVDEWELYDLDDDPIEAVNRATDPDAVAVVAHLRERLELERTVAIPQRNEPWPYVARAGRAVAGASR